MWAIASYPNNEYAANWHTLLLSYAAQLGRDDLKGLPIEKLEARLQQIFHAEPYLIVLDNLESAAETQQIAQKLHQMVGDSPSKVLLTSRERLLEFSFCV